MFCGFGYAWMCRLCKVNLIKYTHPSNSWEHVGDNECVICMEIGNSAPRATNFSPYRVHERANL